VADGADGPQLGVAVVWQSAVHRGAALSAMSNGAVKHHGETQRGRAVMGHKVDRV
jgi:hypothetical protein